MRLLSVIMERQRNNRGLSAIEIEHLVLTTAAAAIDSAANALNNSAEGTFALQDVQRVMEPERILDELKEDFTAMVQQYWPAGVGDELTKERAEPTTVNELGLTATQRERRSIIGDNDGPWPVITRADVRKAHSMEPVSKDPATQEQVAAIILKREFDKGGAAGVVEAIERGQRERRSSLSFPADNAPNVAVHINPDDDSADRIDPRTVAEAQADDQAADDWQSGSNE